LNKDLDLLDAYDSIDTIEGGMSLIKICNSKIDKEIVVVKIPKELSSHDNETRALWLFESRNWLDVGSHQNIVGFRRMHFAGGTPHLVFDLVDNNLRKSINSLNFKKILRIAVGICDAIIHLQSKLKSFVHNDLKPENILLDKGTNPKLADLGVSFSAKNRDLLSNEYKLYYDVNLEYSTILNYGGTEPYKSPEQKSMGEISKLSDIYALGLILYEMITGIIYVRDCTKLDFSHVQKRIEITKNQFDKIQVVILNCIKTNPNDRIQTFEEITTKLREIFFETYNSIIQLPKKLPSKEEKVFGFIDSLIKFGEFSDAENLLKELTDECSIYFLKSKIANKKKDYKKAVEFANLGIQRMTKKNERLYKTILLEQLANGYCGDTQYHLAIGIRYEIAKIEPNLGGNYYNLGRDYSLSGNLSKAEFYFRKSISCSNDLRTYDLLFKTLLKLKKYDEIITELTHLEEFYKQNPIYFRLCAEFLFMVAIKQITENNSISTKTYSLLEKSKKWFYRLNTIRQLNADDSKILVGIEKILSETKNNA
jgi:serine/threonine protein kinase